MSIASKMNIREIARLAGVSVATVSRVINNSESVKPATRERVQAVMTENNYVPSATARDLSFQRSEVVAVVVPDLKNPFFYGLIEGITRVAEKNHYQVLIFNTNEDAQKEYQVLETIRQRNAAGILITAAGVRDGHTGAMLKEFQASGTPVVLIDRFVEGGEGLNLTKEVRDGILRHSGALKPQTLEGECVARADRIAYINHDIDDALRAGVLREFEMPQDLMRVLGETHGQRINTMISDIVRESQDQPHLRMSDEIQAASDEMRAFMFRHVYMDAWRKEEERRCDHVIEALFEYYMEHPGKMPLEYVQISYRDGIERAVTDFLACMTDRYALRTYQQLFVPVSFPVI